MSLPLPICGKLKLLPNPPNMGNVGLRLEKEQGFQQAWGDDSITQMSPAQGTLFCQRTDCPCAIGPQLAPLAKPLTVTSKSWGISALV